MSRTFQSRQLREFHPDNEELDHGPGFIQFEAEQQYVIPAADDAEGYTTHRIRTASNEARQNRRDHAEEVLVEQFGSSIVLATPNGNEAERAALEELRLRFPDAHQRQVEMTKKATFLAYMKNRPKATSRTYEPRQKIFKVSQFHGDR